jgi:hypothetical protein
LLVAGEGPQVREVDVDGVLDQAVDPQPVVGEIAVEQRFVLFGVGVLAVVPEVGRDVLLVVLPGFGVDLLDQVLHWADDGLTDPLCHRRVADRELRRGDPRCNHDDRWGGEDTESDPAVVGPSGVDVVEVDQQPRREHEGYVKHDED